jgi:acetolactate synthase-1/3 small subunit
VTNLSDLDFVERDLALIKVSTKVNKSEIIEIANLFRARIVNVADDALIIEAVGGAEKIDALIQILRNYGIKEVARSGTIALSRNNQKK